MQKSSYFLCTHMEMTQFVSAANLDSLATFNQEYLGRKITWQDFLSISGQTVLRNQKNKHPPINKTPVLCSSNKTQDCSGGKWLVVTEEDVLWHRLGMKNNLDLSLVSVFTVWLLSFDLIWLALPDVGDYVTVSCRGPLSSPSTISMLEIWSLGAGQSLSPHPGPIPATTGAMGTSRSNRWEV